MKKHKKLRAHRQSNLPRVAVKEALVPKCVGRAPRKIDSGYTSPRGRAGFRVQGI